MTHLPDNRPRRKKTPANSGSTEKNIRMYTRLISVLATLIAALTGLLTVIFT